MKDFRDILSRCTELTEAIDPVKLWAEKSPEEIADLLYRHYFRAPGGVFDWMEDIEAKVKQAYVKAAEEQLKPTRGLSGWSYDHEASSALAEQLTQGSWFDYQADKFLANYSFFVGQRYPPYIRIGFVVPLDTKDVDVADAVYVNNHDGYKYSKLAPMTDISVLYAKLRPVVLVHDGKTISFVIIEELQSTYLDFGEKKTAVLQKIALLAQHLKEFGVILAVNNKAPRDQRDDVHVPFIQALGLQKLTKSLARDFRGVVGTVISLVNIEYEVFFAPPGLDLAQLVPQEVPPKPDESKIRKIDAVKNILASTYEPSAAVKANFGIKMLPEVINSKSAVPGILLRVYIAGTEKETSRVSAVEDALSAKVFPEGWSAINMGHVNDVPYIIMLLALDPIIDEVLAAYAGKFAKYKKALGEDIEKKEALAIEGKLKQVLRRAEAGDVEIEPNILDAIRSGLDELAQLRATGEDITLAQDRLQSLQSTLKGVEGKLREVSKRLSLTAVKDLLSLLHGYVLAVDGDEAKMPPDLYRDMENALARAHALRTKRREVAEDAQLVVTLQQLVKRAETDYKKGRLAYEQHTLREVLGNMSADELWASADYILLKTSRDAEGTELDISLRANRPMTVSLGVGAWFTAWAEYESRQEFWSLDTIEAAYQEVLNTKISHLQVHKNGAGFERWLAHYNREAERDSLTLGDFLSLATRDVYKLAVRLMHKGEKFYMLDLDLEYSFLRLLYATVAPDAFVTFNIPADNLGKFITEWGNILSTPFNRTGGRKSATFDAWFEKLFPRVYD